MKSYCESLMAEVTDHLDAVHSKTDTPIAYAEEAIKIMIEVLGKLKRETIKYRFENKAAEIHFFRNVKPLFAAKLIYYNEIYNIESNKPCGTVKSIKRYYYRETKKIKIFSEANIDFYRYYRTGNKSLDKKYFIRGRHDIRLSVDNFYLQGDHRFCTSHDFMVSRILANEQLQSWLETRISSLKKSQSLQQPYPKKAQNWTASKVALVELIYALHTEGVFNEGNSDLKEVAHFFETAMNVDLGQFHRTFLEIRARKSDRAKFLSSLREKLISRMDIADEN